MRTSTRTSTRTTRDEDDDAERDEVVLEDKSLWYIGLWYTQYEDMEAGSEARARLRNETYKTPRLEALRIKASFRTTRDV